MNKQFFNLTSIPKQLQNRVWLERFTINISVTKNIRQELLLQTEFTTNKINFVALSLEGLALIQASWNSQTQEFKVEKLVNTPITSELDIKKIVHDLQAAHWPINKLKEALHSQYSVVDSCIKGVNIRQFFYKNKVILTIHEKAEQVHFKYIDESYEIKLSRIKNSPLNMP